MSILASRKLLLWTLAAVMLLTVPFLAAGSFWSVTPMRRTYSSQVLEVYAASLTTYKADPTTIQGVRPRAEQRGVGIDGALRESPLLPMHIDANPWGSPWPGLPAVNGISLVTGGLQSSEVDLILPSDSISWGIGRSYNSRQVLSGHTSNGYQGKNWFQNSQPELVPSVEFTGSSSADLLYLVYDAAGYVEFKRDSTNSIEFKGKNGAAGGVVYNYDGADADTYTYVDQLGHEYVFFGFDTQSEPAKGQLWKVSDLAGNVAFVGHPTLKSVAIHGQGAIPGGYDSGGRIQTAYDPEDRRWSYTYNPVEAHWRLTLVKAETKGSGSWFDGSASNIAERGRVEYEYYAASEAHGELGDLKLAKVTTPLSESGISVIHKTYYRYWEGSDANYNASTNPGHSHEIKMIVKPEGTRRCDWDGTGFDESFVALTDSELQPYASVSLEYSADRKVAFASFPGACGCAASSGPGVHEFRYEVNPNYTDDAGTPGYDTEWKSRTIVAYPSGNWVAQYFDEVGQSLHRVLTADDPDETDPAPATWATKITRNSVGCVVEISTPANVVNYEHTLGSDSITTSADAGLVRCYDLETSGDLAGFPIARKYKTGTSGTAYLEAERAHTSCSKLLMPSGNVMIVRPLALHYREFPVATTNPTSGQYNQTSFSYTMYSGELVVEEMEVVLPSVSAANNGSGNSASVWQHFTKWEQPDWNKDERGTITFVGKNAQGTEVLIVDANTNRTQPGQDFHGMSIPWNGNASALHRKTSYAEDEQGRPGGTTLPDGRVTKIHYTRLADHRLVVVDYPKFAAGTYYSPARYLVANAGNKVEAEGEIDFGVATSSLSVTDHIDEMDANPITAPYNDWSVTHLTISVYDASGTRLEESRRYFDIPATGQGAEGVHYDSTRYSYDDAGRLQTVQQPSGTLLELVYDAIGRVFRRRLGTDNSGTTSDNMVTISEVEYDHGADRGNSYVTKRIEYVQDGDVGKREAHYSRDVRGHIVIVARPEPPHSFYLLDNMGRRIATGLYSSVSGIDLDGQDSPTNVTASRLGLTEHAYDERGHLWRTRHHAIDGGTGESVDYYDDSSWRDEVGKLVKYDGGELAKLSYDRIGRLTRKFVLAKDDDYEYGHVDDVAGDHVLTETAIGYESAFSDNVFLEATIERFHDDLANGTTGALDVDSDGDPLKLTAADVKGRIQIAARWYDALDRMVELVEFGNNDTDSNSDGDMDTFDRNGLNVPPRGDKALRTSISYAPDGLRLDRTNPEGIVTRYFHDAAGREKKVVRNFIDLVPGDDGGDDDQMIEYDYTDDLLTTIRVRMPSGELDQETVNLYGTTKGAGAGDSRVATGHLLRRVQYSDATLQTDALEYAYNAQSEVIWIKDQSGNELSLDYDRTGKEIHQRVTQCDTAYDSDVLRISTTYDSSGRTCLISQWSSATVGDGAVTDEVRIGYDAWGNLQTLEQDNNGAVGSSGSIDDYEISYTYAKNTAGRNALRRTKMYVTGGREIGFQYLSSGNRLDGEASRVTRIRDNGVLGSMPAPIPLTIVEYRYNGSDFVVGVEYPECAAKRELFSGTGLYPALDNFDRIDNDTWMKDLAVDQAIYDADIHYDRNSNVLRLDDHVHKTRFDSTYTMNRLERLVVATEGDLDGSNSIATKSREQVWALTQTGNWDHESLDLNMDGQFTANYEHNDDREHSKANEITTRDVDDDNTTDYELIHDEAGNMTDDGAAYLYEYDAFYRLRRIRARTSPNPIVAEYRYNGLGFRIAEHVDIDFDGDVDSGDTWRNFAFDDRWRVMAMFEGAETVPTEQYVYHNAGDSGDGTASYIDEIVLCDRDSDNNGSLNERVYYLQSQHFDVVALIDDSGKQVEMVRYSAYGVPFGLPRGDVDSSGTTDSTDLQQIDAWIQTSTYDVRADLNLDGLVNTTDKTMASALPPGGATLGYAQLSGRGNRRGYAGYTYSDATMLYQVRVRDFKPDLGRWMQRDPLVYIDGPNLYEYAMGNPLSRVDPSGMGVGGTGWTDAEKKQPSRDCAESHHGTPGCPPPPDDEADCCKKGYENNKGNLDGHAGRVVCCEGKQTVCSFWEHIRNDQDKRKRDEGEEVAPRGEGEKAADEAISECIKGHEGGHKGAGDNASCEGKPDGDLPKWKDGLEPNAGDKDNAGDTDNEKKAKVRGRAAIELRRLGAEEDCLKGAKNRCGGLGKDEKAACRNAINARIKTIQNAKKDKLEEKRTGVETDGTRTGKG